MGTKRAGIAQEEETAKFESFLFCVLPAVNLMFRCSMFSAIKVVFMIAVLSILSSVDRCPPVISIGFINNMVQMSPAAKANAMFVQPISPV
jgi:hypothetical protein